LAKQSPLNKEAISGALAQGPHPAVVAIIAVLLLFLMAWWAQVNGLLPFFDKWGADQRSARVHEMARSVGGDYDKLTADQRKWIDEVSQGHGRMAISMYGGKAPQGGGAPGGPAAATRPGSGSGRRGPGNAPPGAGPDAANPQSTP
jgi:hypothetical protein